MPLPLTVSCFSKIKIGFAFLVPAHPGSPGQRAVKRVCVCVCLHKMFVIFDLKAVESLSPVQHYLTFCGLGFLFLSYDDTLYEQQRDDVVQTETGFPIKC